MNTVRRWLQTPGIRIMILLFGVLAAINLSAIWILVSARNGARSMALQELRLQTLAHARSIEATLASRRSDFLFLVQTPALVNAPSLLSNADPIVRRWSRLDVEATVLLFLNSRPEIESIVVTDSSGRPLVVAGRRGVKSAPTLLPVGSALAPASGAQTLTSSWPLGSSQNPSGRMEARIRIPALLRVVSPATGPEFSLQPEDRSAIPSETEEVLLVAAPVREDAWTPPIRWILVREQKESSLIQSVGLLASRYRMTVILNLTVIALTALLGVVAIRQVRRTVALEAEKRQQARLRELERQVMHNERLAGLGRLAAGIAHEINNPLEGMSNYLSVLEEDLRSSDSSDALQLVKQVQSGLDRAASIVRQVLTLADPGTAPQTEVHLREVIVETLDFVRSNPAFRHIAFSWDLNGVPPLSGNRVTLGQLFLNLVLNACELQEQGGEVHVRASTAEEWAVVTVADRGPGLKPEDVPRLFDPFYSGRGSTGLGLSICHGIVMQHGGQIRALGREGGGAVFEVRLPLTV